MTNPRLQTAARVWHQAGCCVVPARADGTKAPFGQWKQYMTDRPDAQQVDEWLSNGHYDGFGLICGRVSGNLEMFEIEGRAAHLYDELGLAMIDNGFADLWLRLCNGYVEKTPSGGFHWLYRTDSQPRTNLKLARRPATPDELAGNPAEKVKVLIETRGEGGFTIVAPSGGRTHPAGQPWEWICGSPASIPTITEDERDALHIIAATFDQMPAEEPTHGPASTPRQAGDPLRPGDDFNLRATWHDILTPHGWTRVRDVGGSVGWRRPGKDGPGISATTGRNDADNLYVFSSSAHPFDIEKPYTKFAAHTLLEHAGDYSAAARALHAAGYGDQRAPGPATVTEPAPAAAPAAALPADVEQIWTARPALTHLRTFARARMCSPWAVLGIALARITTTAPPHYVLPPIVGSHASLNLFIALVGPSGGGKGAAESAAQDALDLAEDIYTATVGSGEGIGHLYAHREKGAVIRDRDAVLFTVPEVDNLVALSSRQGATLLPQLRSAWSGERLGFSYADKNKALPLNRHTYRLCLALGVQPGRAAPLLDDADGGTPQRFLWMPTADPDAPDQLPTEPPPLSIPPVTAGPVHADLSGLVSIEVCQTAVTTIIDNRRARLRGNGDALDGHSLLARLKTAAALGILDGRHNVSEEDWHLAGLILTVSDHTRESVVGYLRSTQAAMNEARGYGEGQRAILVSETIQRHTIQRCARTLTRHLQKAGDAGMSKAELRRTLPNRDRQHHDEALDGLVDAGVATVDDGRVKWAPKKP